MMPRYALHMQNTGRIATRFGITLALTYFWAILCNFHLLELWMDFLAERVPAMLRDDFLVRILRPYLRQHFNIGQRSDVIREHYQQMSQFFLDIHDARMEPGAVVATLAGKSNASYTVYMGGNTSKEGEMSFGIYDKEGRYLAKLAGSVGRDENHNPVFLLGGLQGAKPPMGRNEVVNATRDLYGLRPKGAIMLALQCFSQTLGLSAIRTPGNEGHISQRGMDFLRFNKRTIHADYGQFWEEIGGTKIGDEEYSIPVIPQVRDVTEVKPNKRSEWKKRQAVSEALMTEMRENLAALRVQ